MSQEKWFNKKKNIHETYLGRKNKLDESNKEFVKICKLPQKQLKNYLIMSLYEWGYKDVVVGDGFVYAKGSIPFCLTAHMDTVHEKPVTDTYEYNKNGHWIISSPQGIGGDDRCGIYMIQNILRKGYKPYVIFCEDEEIGCVGSKKFCKTNLIEEVGKECKYIIELDRGNGNDAVFYDCDNKDFEKFITENTKYVTAHGSCSDISYLCPSAKIAGVNLSCGYYNAHTLGEYVDMTEMARTQETVEKLLNTECVQYEYIEKQYTYYGGYGYYGGGLSNYYSKKYASWYEDDDEFVTLKVLEVNFMNPETNEYDFDVIEGTDENACWVEFFLNNPNVSWNCIVDYDYYGSAYGK